MLLFKNECTQKHKQFNQHPVESQPLEMKKFLQQLFRKPLTWLANRLSSAPRKDAIFLSLDKLLQNIQTEHKDATILPFDISTSKFIIFSDHHKGVRDLAD